MLLVFNCTILRMPPRLLAPPPLWHLFPYKPVLAGELPSDCVFVYSGWFWVTFCLPGCVFSLLFTCNTGVCERQGIAWLPGFNPFITFSTPAGLSLRGSASSLRLWLTSWDFSTSAVLVHFETLNKGLKNRLLSGVLKTFFKNIFGLIIL